MTLLHCHTCDYVSRTLKSMAEHYRKKHPSKMRRGREKVRRIAKGADGSHRFKDLEERISDLEYEVRRLRK